MLLCADSQLLFWRDGGRPFLARVAESLNVSEQSACYIGAANGDQPEYYELFQAAMELMGMDRCHFIRSRQTEKDLQALAGASVIVLAGGDPLLGWQTIRSLRPELQQARQNGCLLIGVSAGAMHLSGLIWQEKSHLLSSDLTAALGWAPCVIGAHEEGNEWAMLKQVLALTKGCYPGYGLPLGSGMWVDAQGDVTPVKGSVLSLEWSEQGVKESWLASV